MSVRWQSGRHVEYNDLKNQSIEALLNDVQDLATVGTKGQIQSVAALAARLVIELSSGLGDVSATVITAKKQLVDRMDQLTAELATLRTSFKQASDDAGAQTRALVRWTKVLVFVTGVYTVITGGLLVAALIKS